ncbi:MAG: sensor histidine kinase [Rikenellaceae bacterium]|jgi:two-component system phosphate regulon sensor histidine kinase PhoR|nr:sensor histidine kinase [Rikenellaceae bacterium]
MLKIRTIGGAALCVSVVPAGLSAGLVGLAGAGAAWATLVGATTAVAAYWGARYVLTRYIAFRIKPIYQSVYSRNFTTRDLDDESAVKNIEDEIARRHEYRQREIVRLKENERYRKEFLGNVSHELKTPIFNIQGYLDTLLQGALHDPEVNEKYLRRAEKSVDRMINIITDLEHISRLESGTLSLDMSSFDVVAVAREAAEALEMKAEKRGITISVAGGVPGEGDAPVMVRGDRKHISQVLVNLITNSIIYGNENGATRVGFIDMFDKVMVEVEDNGIGIAREEQPRIFERFYRTDKGRSREMGGTGLGLSIVKHILEAHNETISLRSGPGSGSTFSFTLGKA